MVVKSNGNSKMVSKPNPSSVQRKHSKGSSATSRSKQKQLSGKNAESSLVGSVKAEKKFSSSSRHNSKHSDLLSTPEKRGEAGVGEGGNARQPFLSQT
jgi:hypothetical protein